MLQQKGLQKSHNASLFLLWGAGQIAQ